MVSVYEQYTSELHKRFGYLATWLPNFDLALGDVGTVRRDRFDRTTTLKELGISFDVRQPGTAADFEYTSAQGVELGFDLKGKTDGIIATLGSSGAGLSVSFTRGNAVLFVARNCTIASIADRDRLGREILKRYEQGNWPINRRIVTELVTAGSATILISSNGNAHAEFAAATQIAPQGLQLADISGDVRLVRSSGIGTAIVATAGLTPLFRAAGIRTSWFGSEPEFETKGFGGEVLPAEAKRKPQLGRSLGAEFVELAYEDQREPD